LLSGGDQRAAVAVGAEDEASGDIAAEERNAGCMAAVAHRQRAAGAGGVLRIPSRAADTVPLLPMPPAKVASVKDPLDRAMTSTAMPGPWLATMLPRLLIPPEKLEMVTDATSDGASAGLVVVPSGSRPASPPINTPAAPEIVPLLVTPPAKVAKVNDPPEVARPATTIPVSCARILPVLSIPPEKFDKVTSAVPEGAVASWEPVPV